MSGKRSPASGGENVEVYLLGQSGKLQGMTIIAAEPKELTVVNIVGPIDFQKLSSPEGQIGIPKILSFDSSADERAERSRFARARFARRTGWRALESLFSTAHATRQRTLSSATFTKP